MGTKWRNCWMKSRHSWETPEESSPSVPHVCRYKHVLCVRLSPFSYWPVSSVKLGSDVTLGYSPSVASSQNLTSVPGIFTCLKVPIISFIPHVSQYRLELNTKKINSRCQPGKNSTETRVLATLPKSTCVCRHLHGLDLLSIHRLIHSIIHSYRLYSNEINKSILFGETDIFSSGRQKPMDVTF